MTLQEAISNFKIHQQWRLGADIIMIEPKELTESIDIILLQLQEISDEEIYEGIIKQCSIPHDRLCAEINAMIEGAKWYREQLKRRK
jgi:hypothetical protein